MLQGSFVVTASEFTENQYYCVIKLNTGALEPLKSESSKYDWLKHRVNEARFSSLRKELKRNQPASCKNPNAVPGCIDRYSLSDDGSYLVLENHYRDVRALIHDVPADPRWGDYRALKGMLKALRALHSLQVVHCNIKPENILYRVNDDFECVVKFCDLRYACEPGDEVRSPVPADCSYLSFDALHSAVHAQRTGATFGVDIFALALVMWQILQRSTSSPLRINSMFYTQQRHLAPSWLADKIKCDTTSGSEGVRCAVGSLAQFASFIIRMTELSFAEDCSLSTLDDLLELLEDFEPDDAVLAKLDEIFGAVQSIERKVDTAFKTIKTRGNSLRKDIAGIAACSRANAQQGAHHADTLKAVADFVAKGVHALTTANSTQSVSCNHLLLGLTEMRRDFSRHAESSSQAYASLMGSVDTHLADITGELQAIGEVNQQDHTTRVQLRRAVNRLSSGLQAAETTLMDAHAAIKAEAAAQAQRHNASSIAIHSLLTGEHAVPTKFVLLPELEGNTWTGQLNPMRLVRDKYRLFFVCDHTNQIVCGPGRDGYVIENLKDWVAEVAPYVQAALIAISIALVISEVPLPIARWCQIPNDVVNQTKYLRAAFTFIEDAAGTAAFEFTAEQLAEMCNLTDEDLKRGSQDRTRAAQLISALKNKNVITDTRGLEPVLCAVTGHTAWVRDDEDTVQNWRNAWPDRLFRHMEGMARTLIRSILTVAKALQYDMLFIAGDAVVRAENMVKSVTSASGKLVAHHSSVKDYRDRIDECLNELGSAVSACAAGCSRAPLSLASAHYAEQESQLRKEISIQLDYLQSKAPRQVPVSIEKISFALSGRLALLISELERLIDNASRVRNMRDPPVSGITQVLSDCIMYLTSRGSRDCPQLPLLLPCVPREWEVSEPLLLRKVKCRLLFLCSFSKLPLPCGLDGSGHNITLTAQTSDKLAPLVALSLLVVVGALKQQSCEALPAAFFGAKLDTKELQLQYLYAVLDLVTQPASVTEQTYTLDTVLEFDASGCLDIENVRNQAEGAYVELSKVLQLHNLQRDKCAEWGMRQVKGLWIADSDVAEAQMAAVLASP
jgi:serine/threonine protein kinase